MRYNYHYCIEIRHYQLDNPYLHDGFLSLKRPVESKKDYKKLKKKLTAKHSSGVGFGVEDSFIKSLSYLGTVEDKKQAE